MNRKSYNTVSVEVRLLNCILLNKRSFGRTGLLWILVAVLLSIFFPSISKAQSGFTSQPAGKYKYYDITKIHSNEVIKGICKDENGLIWLATDQGVLRFDGSETSLFYKELPSPYTKKFLKRKNGQFLVLTDLGIKEIIQTRDTTYFRPMQVGDQPFNEPLNYPKSMFEDKEGNLWIGEVFSVVKVSENGFKRYDLGSSYQSINYHRSFSFAEDAFGHVWIAPFNGRLLSYNKAEDRLVDVEIEYPLSEVTSIEVLKGDHLLIGGKEGVLQLKIDSGKNILENRLVGGPENISSSLLVNNELYLGTWDNGLFYSNLEDPSYSFSRLEELPYDDVLDFYHDEQYEEIWLTGSENIGLLKKSVIKSVGAVGKYRVESLTFDSLGNLYYSTGQEILKIDPEKAAEVEKVFSSKSTYFDRIEIEGDKIWIGEAFGAISYLDLSKNSLQSVDEIVSGSGPVKFILKDKEDNKWFTGLWDLVKVGPDGKIEKYEEVRNSVAMGQGPSGQIFCGGQGKDSLLYRYNEERDAFDLIKLSYDFSVPENIYADDIAFDSLGNPWLATTEGLLCVKEKNGVYKAERIALKGIDINEPLNSIAIIGDQMWLAYSYALVSYHQGQVVLYTRENGLPSRILKERCFKLHDNKLFVATAKGLAQINIQRLNFRQTPQPLLKGTYVNGERFSVSEGEGSNLPYGARLQFNFVSPAYPGNNLIYQTRLLGLEEGWSEPSSNSSISVFGFSEGTYTLQVRSRDMGYLWSEPMELTFTVAAPWYKSWWAIALLLLLVLGLIYAAIQVYNLHLIKQKKKLQMMVEVRTREINLQKNEIIEQKNKLIQQKEELIEKNNAVFRSQKALSEADLNFMHLKEKQLQDQIEYRNKQITTHTLNIIQKNEMLRDLRDQLESIAKLSSGATQNELKRTLKLIDESFRLDKEWEEFKLYFEQIYTGFYAKLKINYPELTNQELRHCALIRLNLSNAECASLLGISPASIKVTRTRLRKKLNLENHQSLTDLVMGI